MYESNEFSRLLYTRLAQDPNYQYLDPDLGPCLDSVSIEPQASKLLENLRNREIHTEESISDSVKLDKEVLISFKDWNRGVQLQIGYLLHLHGNINSKQCIDILIQQLVKGGLQELSSHDLVTLLILIYVRKDYTLEDLCEYMDVGELQSIFACKIESNVLKPEEICAASLGLKSIKDMRINNVSLRTALYRHINNTIADPKIKDFYLMTLMTLLTKENEIYHDSSHLIHKALEDFENLCADVSLMTSIKMMSFGISQGIENEKLNKLVSDRVLANLDQLNLKDIKSLTHFYSRSSNVNKKLLFTLKGEISIYFENAVSISELVDVMNCLSYMSVTEVYRLEVIFPILESFKHTEPSEVVHKNLASIAETIVKNLAKTALNSDKILSDMSTLRSNRRYASTICRVPAFLCFNLRLDEIDLEHSMSMDLAAAILALHNKKLPVQLKSPQMSMDGIDNRSRLLVTCYRSLVRYLGHQRFAGVARLLPQFPEPDLVFGHIAGVAASVPEYLTDPTILRPKRAPVGEWTVLIIASKKNINSDSHLTALEHVKVRQLRKVGFNPVVLPYSALKSPELSFKMLPKLLTKENVTLPNLDDGKMVESKNF